MSGVRAFVVISHGTFHLFIWAAEETHGRLPIRLKEELEVANQECMRMHEPFFYRDGPLNLGLRITKDNDVPLEQMGYI